MVGKGYGPIRVDRTGVCLQFGTCKQTGIIILRRGFIKTYRFLTVLISVLFSILSCGFFR